MTRGTDTTFFRKVLQMFIDQGDELFIEMADALSMNDIIRLGSIAHKLKGSSLNLGAEALAETCRIIELKGRNNDLSGMEALVKKLSEEYNQTRKQLIAIIEETE